MSVSVDAIGRVIILAGARREADPLLQTGGASHKALLDVGGRPMIARVASALAAAGLGERIIVTAAPEICAGITEALAGLAEVEFMTPAASPSATFLAAINSYKHERGLLVTACDHVLLTADMVRAFLNGVNPQADVAAAVVERDVFRADFPEARRTFIKLKDGAFSGANLFWVNPARAAPLFAFWRRLEENRKNPLKMARAIGVSTAIAYLTGALDRAGLMAALKRKTGVHGQLVPLPFARAAIDVDKPADLELVRKLMGQGLDV